ncbi:hypothetical protein GPECTOR_17g950 [Gonium pectorale]|uniref:Uncharacterized protein n=1 Tax=Gonium pectorale TaxID=33097 RepID=A0A150GKI9_GONPE|nr:hypothetical protein GPECTOR_17g950 [Gonium pectorale]|eukprot:KXZ50311.1 hypothetical protein GPECTOR_17g950 [Gonium pectorale]
MAGYARSRTLPTAAVVAALVARVVDCRMAALRTSVEVPDVHDSVLGPMLPVHLAPATPAFLKPMLKDLLNTIDAKSAEAVAALQAELDGRPKGAPGAGVRVHALGGNSWIARGVDLVEPPFTNTTHDTHISSRFHKWVALEGVLPRLQQLRILPLGI